MTVSIHHLFSLYYFLFLGIKPLEMCPKKCLLDYIRVFIVTVFKRKKT